MRYFGLAFGLFLASLIFAFGAVTQKMPSFRWAAASLLIAAGCVSLILQLKIGFALDRRWVARYGRTTEPVRYWTSVLLAVALVVFWVWIAKLFIQS